MNRRSFLVICVGLWMGGVAHARVALGAVPIKTNPPPKTKPNYKATFIEFYGKT